MTTAAPCRASSIAVCSPSPTFAPVTTAVVPVRSGICAGVHGLVVVGSLLMTQVCPHPAPPAHRPGSGTSGAMGPDSGTCCAQ